MTTIRTGDRIRLLHMPDDPDPIPAGSTGTIESVTEGPLGQVWVRWDSGRSLALVPGVDRFEVIERGPEPDEPAGPSPVTVPHKVYVAVLAIRASGLTNMLDLPAVTGLARKLGFPVAARWLDDPANRKAYAEGIFRGFKAEE